MKIRNIGIKQSKLKRLQITKQGKVKTFSTIEKLAYNNASTYEFNGEKFNYSKKQIDDFLSNNFILPTGTKTDKNKLELFKETEEKFKKNDAFLAMNYIINLPRMDELDPEVSKKIILDFFQKQSNEKKNFVDVSFHIKNKGTDKENFHCHILESRRAIDKNGNIGNAIRGGKGRDFDSKLDDIKWIREELAKAFNEALKQQNNHSLRYTHLSNEDVKAQALEQGNFELAIEKDYATNTINSKVYDSQFYKKRNNKAYQEKTRAIREVQKRKAQQYKQNKAELERLEKQQKELLDKKLAFELDQENLNFEENTKMDLDEFLAIEENQKRIFELVDEIELFEQEREETKQLYNDLIVEFYKKTETIDFSSKRKIKEVFKDYLKNQNVAIDDFMDYKLNLLSYKIFSNEEKYIEKAEYLQVKQRDLIEKEKYNSFIDIDESALTDKQRSFICFIEIKENLQQAIFKSVINEMITQGNTGNLLSVVTSKFNDHPAFFNSIDVKVKSKQLEKYILKNFEDIKQNKEKHILKNAEFIKYLDNLEKVKKEVTEIKEKTKFEKEKIDLLRDVLTDFDDNAEQIFKLVNSKHFINLNQQQNIKNTIRNGFTY